MNEVPRMFFGKYVAENLRIFGGEECDFDYNKEPTFSEMVNFPNVVHILSLLVDAVKIVQEHYR